jgi:hypothetical protein
LFLVFLASFLLELGEGKIETPPGTLIRVIFRFCEQHRIDPGFIDETNICDFTSLLTQASVSQGGGAYPMLDGLQGVDTHKLHTVDICSYGK